VVITCAIIERKAATFRRFPEGKFLVPVINKVENTVVPAKRFKPLSYCKWI
jgi:hypothetical protein